MSTLWQVAQSGVWRADSSKAITKHLGDLKTEMQHDMSSTCLHDLVDQDALCIGLVSSTRSLIGK